MGKLSYSGILIVLITSIFALNAYSQEAQEAYVKKQSPIDRVAESDQDHYVIGPEDVLNIHVWREEALSRTVPVRMDGNISLPLIQEMKAAGLTPLQLKKVLTERLKEFIEDPNVSVTVMEANSFRVHVSGQVRTPGVYRLRSETSLLQIIPMAGGFTEWANQKKILVIRKQNGNEQRMTINYKRIIDGKDLGLNIVLRSGDTIIIP